MRNFANILSNNGGLFNGKTPTVAPPPPQYGIIGAENNLPFNYSFAAGWIFGCFFECTQNSTLIDHSFRGYATTTTANVRAGVYTLSGPDAGNDLYLSPDILVLNTGGFQTLTFSQNKPLLAGSFYWFLIQGDQDITIPYDNVAGNQYTALFGYPFGGFPLSYSGAFLNTNIIQTWGTYEF